MLIQIGVQDSAGYSEACCPYFGVLHDNLTRYFRENMKTGYFKTIHTFWMGFRVSGKIRDFDHDGPEKMRYARKRGEMTIDLSFPESSWRRVHPYDLHAKIIEGVEECIDMMLNRAIKEKEVLDLEGFRRDVSTAIESCRDPKQFDAYDELIKIYKTIKYNW